MKFMTLLEVSRRSIEYVLNKTASCWVVVWRSVGFFGLYLYVLYQTCRAIYVPFIHRCGLI